MTTESSRHRSRRLAQLPSYVEAIVEAIVEAGGVVPARNELQGGAVFEARLPLPMTLLVTVSRQGG